MRAANNQLESAFFSAKLRLGFSPGARVSTVPLSATVAHLETALLWLWIFSAGVIFHSPVSSFRCHVTSALISIIGFVLLLSRFCYIISLVLFRSQTSAGNRAGLTAGLSSQPWFTYYKPISGADFQKF